MPAIRISDSHPTALLWSGDCPGRGCRERFEIEAEPWQSKIEVLSSVRYLPRPDIPHLHGKSSIFGYHERGGE